LFTFSKLYVCKNAYVFIFITLDIIPTLRCFLILYSPEVDITYDGKVYAVCSLVS